MGESASRFGSAEDALSRGAPILFGSARAQLGAGRYNAHTACWQVGSPVCFFFPCGVSPRCVWGLCPLRSSDDAFAMNLSPHAEPSSGCMQCARLELAERGGALRHHPVRPRARPTSRPPSHPEQHSDSDSTDRARISWHSAVTNKAYVICVCLVSVSNRQRYIIRFTSRGLFTLHTHAVVLSVLCWLCSDIIYARVCRLGLRHASPSMRL